jgi:uncharacterized protein (UPF0264 family)
MSEQKTMGRRVRFLASVTDVSEALLAAGAGADIIDGKNPARGALGALAPEIVAAIRASLPPHIPVSATIGDIPADDPSVPDAIFAVAAAGVTYVKIGFFGGAAPARAIARLGRLPLGACRLVGVLLADREPDFDLVGDMASAGFAGVMLDTEDKASGALPDVMSVPALAAFITTARRHGLFAGLAGSLRAHHIPRLVRLEPDLLGFRGALCRNSSRCAGIDVSAVAAVARAIALVPPCENAAPLHEARAP